MAATSFRVTLAAAVAAILAGEAQAQYPQPQFAAPTGIRQANGVQAVARPPVLRPTPNRQAPRFIPVRMVPTGVRSPSGVRSMVPQRSAAAAGVASTRYPQTGAALYPAPRVDVPHQVGGTIIVNQALAPHEMMHAHQYRAMYPPFYYKVSGSWIVTPFGVESQDHWELRGTEVEVKYHDRIQLKSRFVPPIFR